MSEQIHLTAPRDGDPAERVAGDLKDRAVNTATNLIYLKLIATQWELRQERRALERRIDPGPPPPTEPPAPADSDRLAWEAQPIKEWSRDVERQAEVITAPLGAVVKDQTSNKHGIVVGEIDNEGEFEVALMKDDDGTRWVDPKPHRFRFDDLVLIDNMDLPPVDLVPGGHVERLLIWLHPDAVDRHAEARQRTQQPRAALPPGSPPDRTAPAPEPPPPTEPRRPMGATTGQEQSHPTQHSWGSKPQPRRSPRPSNPVPRPRYRPRSGPYPTL